MSFDASRYTKSKWLKADDIDGDEIVTISQAYEHTFERDQETKPVIEFLELDQALVLNKTRTLSLVKAFGPDSAEWIGKEVELSLVPTSMGDSISLKKVKQGKKKEAEVLFEE